MKIELGCGKSTAPGFVGVDIDPAVGPDVVADIRKLPFDDGSVSEIRAVHCIEHIPWQEIGDVLREWARVLASGGKIFLSTPSLKFILKGHSGKEWKSDFACLRPGEKAFCSIDGRPSRDKWVNFKLFSSQRGWDKHCACFSGDWLGAELRRAGFEIVSMKEAPTLDIHAARTAAGARPKRAASVKTPGQAETEDTRPGLAGISAPLRQDIEQLIEAQPTISPRPGKLMWAKRILLQLMRPFARQQILFNGQVVTILKRVAAAISDRNAAPPDS